MQLTRRKAWVAENILILPIIALLAGAITYWLLIVDRAQPVDLENGYIIPQSVTPGERISAQWTLIRQRNSVCSGILSRSIVDSTNVVWRQADQSVYDRVYPSHELIAKEIIVPFGASWGPAKYRLQLCFRCEGLSLTRQFPVCWSEPDLPFSIVPPKGAITKDSAVQ